MRTLKHILLLVLLLAASALKAGNNDAEVTALLGKAEFSSDGQRYRHLMLGQWVPEGVHLRTGERSSLVLRFEDGSTLGLRQNTLVLMKKVQAAPVRTGVFQLLKGFTRAVVRKLGKDDSFEVRTPNAVAAVKGTDFEAGFEQGRTQVLVFESGGAGVLLMDLDREQSQVYGAGQGGGFDERGLQQPHELSEQERQQSDAAYGAALQQLRGPEPGPQGGQGQGPGQGQTPQPTPGPGTQGQSGGLQQALDAALGDLQDTLDQAQQSETAERFADAFSGLALVDRDGVRVQVSREVNRPAPEVVEKVSYTRRQDGGQPGTSVFSERLSFNRALPSDWTAVADRGLNDAANLDGSGQPLYWKTRDALAASSPGGDNWCVVRQYQSPSGAPGAWGQGWSQYYNVNHAEVGYHDFNALGIMTGGDSIAVSRTLLGGVSWRFDYYNLTLGRSMFSLDLRLLSADGLALAPAGYLDNPLGLKSFSLIARPVSIDLMITAPSFRPGGVHVLLVPGFMHGDL
jgi:hypothetical protein